MKRLSMQWLASPQGVEIGDPEADVGLTILHPSPSEEIFLASADAFLDSPPALLRTGPNEWTLAPAPFFGIRLRWSRRWSPRAVLREVEWFLAENGMVEEFRFFRHALAWGSVGAAVNQETPSSLWLGMLLLYWGALVALLDEPTPRQHLLDPRQAAYEIVEAQIRQGGPALRGPQLPIADLLPFVVAFGQASLKQAGRLGEIVNLKKTGELPRPQDGETSPLLNNSLAVAIGLLLQGVTKGRARLTFPVEGKEANLSISSPYEALWALTQVEEFVLGNIPRNALDWFCGGEFPHRFAERLFRDPRVEPQVLHVSTGEPPPAFDTPSERERRQVLAFFADQAVKEALEKQRYVPPGHPLLLDLDRGLPFNIPPLREMGITGLALWAEPEGLWVQILAPDYPSDGVTIRWVPRLDGPRLTRLLLAEWVMPYFDVLLAMLWHDLVVAGEEAFPRQAGSAAPKKRRRRRRTSDKRVLPPSDKPVLRVPRRLLVYRGGTPSRVQWGTESQRRHAVRAHAVAGHLRRLPQGWHRSPQAEQYAREYGYLLPDDPGVTFVRPHLRGGERGEAPVEHRVVARGLNTLAVLFGK